MLILYIVALLITPTAFCAYPLHDAVKNNRIGDLKTLITAGADVNETDQYGNTPLHIAADERWEGAIRILLAAGAKVNATTEDGYTPLHIAAFWKNIDTTAALTTAGADVNIPNKNGDTPLHIAASRGWKGVIQILVDAGTRVNIPNKYGDTPLHNAAKRGNTSAVQILIDAGAGVNIPNKYGSTPLHQATHRFLNEDEKHIATIKTLLTAGARLDKYSTPRLTQRYPSLLALACVLNPANLEFLERLTRQGEFDPELFAQIHKEYTAIQKGRLAKFREEHGAHTVIALLQNQRRGQKS